MAINDTAGDISVAIKLLRRLAFLKPSDILMSLVR